MLYNVATCVSNTEDLYEWDVTIEKYSRLTTVLIYRQVEDTCMVALATAYNARETEGGTTKQELLHFVEEVN